MKYLILLAVLVSLGLLSHNDEVELISQMKSTCHKSYLVVDGQLERDCEGLIARIESESNLKVEADAYGYFWVTGKATN